MIKRAGNKCKNCLDLVNGDWNGNNKIAYKFVKKREMTYDSVSCKGVEVWW